MVFTHGRMIQSNPPEKVALLAYTGRWLVLATLVGLLSGTASALFLLALDAATGYRESHRWIVWLLPVAGFLVGWVYLKIGQGVEAGNNLLIDEIHDPQKVVPLRMAPLILLSTVISHLFGASVGREGTAARNPRARTAIEAAAEHSASTSSMVRERSAQRYTGN